jgi:hypothetical protein
MAAFSHQALAAYLPRLQRLVSDTLAGWADLCQGERATIRWPAPLKRLAVETICATVIGPAPRPVVDGVIADCQAGTGGVRRPRPPLALEPLPPATVPEADLEDPEVLAGDLGRHLRLEAEAVLLEVDRLDHLATEAL